MGNLTVGKEGREGSEGISIFLKVLEVQSKAQTDARIGITSRTTARSSPVR